MPGAESRAVTRGHPAALAEVRRLIESRSARAVLLAGPESVGKTTLALDLAAGLLCHDPDPGARPCRSCRSCRLLALGTHGDLHRLAPSGPGGQVKIGDQKNPEPGTVRHLIGEMALLPGEGSARVALVEKAHRLNPDAQNALLKLLEEPPAGATVVLCADDEEVLLPTVRSRCVRIRMGTATNREIEDWLGELGAADAPTASRSARLSRGRPGLALAYASSADAVRARAELSRGLLDMLGMGRKDRLTAVRELLKTAASLDSALANARGRGGSPKRKAGSKPASLGSAAQPVVPAGGAGEETKTPAAIRRAAAATLIDIWVGIARDLAVARDGPRRSLREADLLEELVAIAPRLDRSAVARFIEKANWVAAQADLNLSPELALDVLALEWPHDPTAKAPPVARSPRPARAPSPEPE
jgi:DNA polymerase III subunit delta'